MQLSPPPTNNKASYTATQVGCVWAGAIFEITRPFGQEQKGPRTKINKKKLSLTDQPTDGWTDGRTDKAGCTRLKINKNLPYEFTFTSRRSGEASRRGQYMNKRVFLYERQPDHEKSFVGGDLSHC